MGVSKFCVFLSPLGLALPQPSFAFSFSSFFTLRISPGRTPAAMYIEAPPPQKRPSGAWGSTGPLHTPSWGSTSCCRCSEAVAHSTGPLHTASCCRLRRSGCRGASGARCRLERPARLTRRGGSGAAGWLGGAASRSRSVMGLAKVSVMWPSCLSRGVSSRHRRAAAAAA